jgi:hypothetical protein
LSNFLFGFGGLNKKAQPISCALVVIIEMPDWVWGAPLLVLTFVCPDSLKFDGKLLDQAAGNTFPLLLFVLSVCVFFVHC